MSSQIATIAEAVKTALNAGSFVSTFTAERVYCPLKTLEGIEDLQVLVVAKDAAMSKAARNRSLQGDIQIDVGIVKRITQTADPTNDDSNTEIDLLMELAEQITALYSAGGTAGAGQWFATERAVLYDQDRLLNQKTFLTIITFTFRI